MNEKLEKIKQMVWLQDDLNIFTNGKKWTKGITNNNRKINWFRCIYMEACEAIDSFNWKHWKDINSKDDLNNLKIEIVDIWHFLISQEIVNLGTKKTIEKLYKEYENNQKILSQLKYDKNKIIILLENMIKDAIEKKINIKDFYQIIYMIPDFSIDKIYTLYIGKNILNQFRQKHGYKEKTYIKDWNGNEDNVYMQEKLNQNPNITANELYLYLEEYYKNNVIN